MSSDKESSPSVSDVIRELVRSSQLLCILWPEIAFEGFSNLFIKIGTWTLNALIIAFAPSFAGV